MFQGKEVIVKLSEEANEMFEELDKLVKEERQKGIESSFHQTLLRSILRVRTLLKENPFAGDQVPKRQMPRKYSERYDAENIWRIELANRWRLVYTITGNQIEIITFVLDIYDHKDYDKVFGYKH
ncbi:hypothetical protein J4233_01335 [Candidatus Pacearchaeota archaeon]|nr:hypothetical protein [Candidatus Pacearchaeota archaeon]